jgi:hypothetical protein
MDKFVRHVFGISLLVIMPSVSVAAPLSCVITAKFACMPAGCGAVETGMFSVIDMQSGSFSRCDRRGCDEYEATFSSSGQYIVIDLPGRGMVAKMSANGAEYLEVTTLGTNTLVSFGACKPQ